MTTLLIDGNYLSYQSFHAMGRLSHEGIGTGVVFGFLSRCLDLGHRFRTNRLIFCWDSRNSYRRKAYPDYKAARKTKTKREEVQRQEIYRQIEALKTNLLPAVGWSRQFEQYGLEADDIMAKLSETEQPAIIVTSDEDLFQCLRGDDIKVWNPRKRKLWNEATFTAERKVTPIQWAMVKSLAGCSSDNVKGIAGVGEGTAVKWLRGELKPGKKLDLIEAKRREVTDINFPLVRLPHVETVSMELPEDRLSLSGLIRVANDFGLESFKEAPGLDRWATLFDGEYEGPSVQGQYNKTDRGKATNKLMQRRNAKRGFGI